MDATQFDLVRAAARTYAPDAYIAATLAPAAAQQGLITLAAFSGDIDRILASVGEPALAEIRLEWWRDALHAAAGERTGHPLADALREAMARHSLPLAEFDAVLHARTHDLYADPVPDEAALQFTIAAADGALLRVAARMVPGANPASPLIEAAASAIGRTRLLATYARLHARGRNPFPVGTSADSPDFRAEIARTRAALTRARALWREAPTDDRIPCLPLSLVAPYLAAMQRSGHDPVRMMAEIAPLTRVSRVWAAWALGRV